MLSVISPRTFSEVERTPTCTPGAAVPELSRGSLHIWKADLERVEDELDECLCEQEQTRARLLAGARHQTLWRRSRSLLRTLLGSYLGQPPAELEFASGLHGKPSLQTGGEELQFNLSHSRQFALVAICHEGEVGVDVEVVREPTVEVVRLAERAFGRPEAERLQRLDRGSHSHEFMRKWTRREAELKCRGIGLGGPVEMQIGEPWVHELTLGPGLAGAVACDRPIGQLHYLEWPPSGTRTLS
jgi:4'-phosphopantetheinyl transferase